MSQFFARFSVSMVLFWHALPMHASQSRLGVTPLASFSYEQAIARASAREFDPNVVVAIVLAEKWVTASGKIGCPKVNFGIAPKYWMQTSGFLFLAGMVANAMKYDATLDGLPCAANYCSRNACYA